MALKVARREKQQQFLTQQRKRRIYQSLICAAACNKAKTFLLPQKKSDVYSVEINGLKALEKPETGDEVKYKDLKGNKKKKNEELKKELDLVSTANSTSAGRTASTTV